MAGGHGDDRLVVGLVSYHEVGRLDDHVARVREQVQQYALERGTHGFTDKELEGHFGDYGSTYRTRRSELSAAGVIVATDSKRKTPSGRNAIVHVHRNYQEGHQLSLI